MDDLTPIKYSEFHTPKILDNSCIVLDNSYVGIRGNYNKNEMKTIENDIKEKFTSELLRM